MNAPDYFGRTPLHVIATTTGHIKIAEYLLSQEINMDQLDCKERSALYLAIEAENFQVANLLVEKGASIVAGSGRLSRLLCDCGFRGSLETLRCLIRSEVNLNEADYDMRTIGHLAASENHFMFLRMLAEESNYDFSLKDRWGRTALDDIKV